MRLSENVGSNEAFIILFYFDIFSLLLPVCFLFYVMDLNKSFHLFWEIFMNYVNLHCEGTEVKIHQKRENPVPFSPNSHEKKILQKSFLLLLCRRIRVSKIL